MTGPDDVLRKLDEAAAGIEKLNLQQMTVEPKRAQELVEVLSAIKEAVEAARAWQHEQEHERRLATLFEEFGAYTAAAHERLSTSEGRLSRIEQLVGGTRAAAFEPDPEVVAEGAWLKGVLAGPPSDDSDPQLLKDAPRRPIKAAIDVLAAELSARTKSPAASKARGS